MKSKKQNNMEKIEFNKCQTPFRSDATKALQQGK